MLQAGLVSITFRQLSPEQIIDLVGQAGQKGVEWGGDVHVPHGEYARAETVRELTVAAGLAVTSYGSYYRLAESEAEGLMFESVLDTARALGAPLIRVWAGGLNAEDADDSYRRRVVDEAHRTAALAAAHHVHLAYEFHGGSLTNTNESAVALLDETRDAGLRTYWQPPNGQTTAYCLEGLRAVSACLAHVHVFHWGLREGRAERRPLSEGAHRWRQFLPVIAQVEGDRWLLLEFAREDSPEQYLRDAAALREWLEGAT